jgi:hypothetical protein
VSDEPVGEVDSKTAEYIRRSERAAADVATWPEWMQRNLKPPTETVEVPKALIPGDTDGY